jgi:hypothetical protein
MIDCTLITFLFTFAKPNSVLIRYLIPPLLLPSWCPFAVRSCGGTGLAGCLPAASCELPAQVGIAGWSDNQASAGCPDILDCGLACVAQRPVVVRVV